MFVCVKCSLQVFPCVRSCQLWTEIILLLALLFWCLFIFILTWILWLGLSIPCWIQQTRIDILALFLTYRESFQFSMTKYDISCPLLLYGLYYVEVVTISHKSMLNIIKGFSCTSWNDCVVFTIHSVYIVYHTDFLMKHPNNSRNKSHLVMAYNPFNLHLQVFYCGFLHQYSSRILVY